MARERKTAAHINLAKEDMLLAEEDLAAMRPALAVAPELVLQTIEEARKRSARRRAKKRAAARKGAAKRLRKTAVKRARKAAPKKKKRVATARKKTTARKK